ncbi:NAD(P)-dependent oxidoreductase [Kribbella solani]|uniref:NAD(P)-dependent oxidoreductase n=1 Tax=Kribbella solani TaxID=236067 RepID=UPI0029B2F8BB|nr:NAD(P)-dependent oxidoreductase [Kribbella solani]MDX2970133.1 NAD(P)-dependent oxidoreductase [Kribbella solani]MDX3004232.1 NAD(P)-dependent oxidoreductase [Kribbella solani]
MTQSVQSSESGFGSAPTRVLVVGDPYLPATVFERALSRLEGPVRTTSIQIERIDPEPARTPAEECLREYAGDPQVVVDALPGHEVLVVHGAPVSEQALSVPGLRLVCCARGGPVNVDVGAATARGIPVVGTPGKNARAVAELTVAFTLLLLRRVPKSARHLLDGAPLGLSAFEGRAFFGHEAAGATLGLVGLGHVGRTVVPAAVALGLRVLAYDPFAATPPPPGCRQVSLAELVAESDVVSVHARATPDNRHLIDAELLAAMRPGAALVNTARESLVDERALLAALESGHLSGAALDVFEPAPPGRPHPLLARPDVLLTPHIGGATFQTLERGADMIAAAIEAYAAGSTLPDVVNADALRARVGA